MSIAPELQPIGILEHLSEDEVHELSTYGEFVPVQEGQALITEGEQQNSLYLLVSGSLKVQITVKDRKINVGVVQPGQCVGEVNIFDPEEASATVSGAEFCQAWRIDRDMLNSFLAENPSAAAKFLIGIAHQLATRVRDSNATMTRAKDALPLLSHRLKEIKDIITAAQDELPALIAML